MSIKKLLIVAGALALAGCQTAPCRLVEGPEEHASDEYVCDAPSISEPQVEPAGDVQP